MKCCWEVSGGSVGKRGVEVVEVWGNGEWKWWKCGETGSGSGGSVGKRGVEVVEVWGNGEWKWWKCGETGSGSGGRSTIRYQEERVHVVHGGYWGTVSEGKGRQGTGTTTGVKVGYKDSKRSLKKGNGRARSGDCAI
ncbi:hypothetical protein Pcinc_037439 [Petrolisthes cinctipes]|uniref:Uncharacterized protein n=1 Tax=Petrolisthes cinctipes TaxID=88211 RepID=A0AAE1BSS9_PETCI|nr:hypothetical protein Pcinc_037439 [Petrolisthes cinctipes]